MESMAWRRVSNVLCNIWGSTVVLLDVSLQSSFHAKGSDASRMRTNEFLQSSVDDEEVVDDLFVGSAVDATLRADRLPAIRLQMRQQMQAILVSVAVEMLKADAAIFCE